MDKFEVLSVVAAVVLFVAIVALTEVGRNFGRRRFKADPEGAFHGTAALEGGVFGLMGLLVGFTFAGAAERFDHRRELIVEETTAIEAAYLRVDVVAPAARPELKDLFRQYLDSRLAVYRQLPDIERANAERAHSQELQEQIWRQAVAKTHSEGMPTSSAIVLLPAINQMIDVETKRTMATKMHPPKAIFVMLFGLLLVGSLIAGYSMAERKLRSWLHVLTFAATTTFAFYVIIDMEFPRFGVIQVSAFDSALLDLRHRMDEAPRQAQSE